MKGITDKQINDILTTKYTIHNGQLYKKSKKHLILINGERKVRIFIHPKGGWFAEENIKVTKKDKTELVKICEKCEGRGIFDTPFCEEDFACEKCEGRGYLK